MAKLSVVLATKNEEENVGRCLGSIREIANEIVVVDEYSTDNTREIAAKYGASVYLEPHHEIFHVSKQKALERATGDWILQLDADERVTPELRKEIKEVINLSTKKLKSRKIEKQKERLFKRHQELVEKRDGKIGKDSGEIVAFFVPRQNFFLGKPIRYAGVYPDGVIRLVKKGKAHFPAKSVHEQIRIDGEVAWLFNDLEHHDTPTFSRYIERFNRYTDLQAKDLERKNAPRNIFYFFFYSILKPIFIFLKLFIRHKGYLDGMHGFVWSFFSALHYPIAYFKYWTSK